MKSLSSLLILVLFTISTSKIVRFKVPENLRKAKITVKENTVFDLRFYGNPTTGYEWFISNVDQLDNYDIKPLNVEGDYYSEQHNDDMVGFGGIYSFKFNSGSASNKNKVIKFIYKREWEQSEYDINVTIYVSVKK